MDGFQMLKATQNRPDFTYKFPSRRGLLGKLSFITVLLLAALAGKAAAATGSFPRIGSVWWGESIYTANPAQAAQIQLFLAPGFTTAAAKAVSGLNPDAPVLASMNAMETTAGVPAVPDSYYLLDVNGNRIQNWPGTPGNFLLNMTNPAVVQFMAQYAYQQMTKAGFKYDGVFFDNVEMMISNMTTDCYGNPIQINDNYPGPPDPTGVLDQKWSQGMFNLLSAFKQLAPGALISVHANQLPEDPRAFPIANGDALVFDAEDIREGTQAFGNLWDTYQQWFSQGQQPVITTLQSSPPNQIAYGYGYSPLTTALPSTIAFGQTVYASMRFGLGMALMNNGYFIYDFGDSSSPVTWWYDEYNFNLGQPAAPATLLGAGPGTNQIVNSNFSSGLSPWRFGVTNDGSGQATAAIDATGGVTGGPAAHISVTSPATVDWHMEFQQGNLQLTAGQEYEVQFQARGGAPLTFEISTQGGTAPYASYGLNSTVTISQNWAQYSVYFVASATASDGILEFRVGNQAGDIWLDNVQLVTAPTRIYRRDFTNGVVLLNGTSSPQTISLESGLTRFTGSQAPRYQYIVDDASSGFSASGSWAVNTYDTGWRKANGPYYHAWQSTLHELDSGGGSAQWNLNPPQPWHYTIQAWLPAAPSSGGWTNKAIYNLMSGGKVIATTTLDQSQAAGGDQWFTLFTDVYLTAPNPYVTIQNGGSGPLIADALYITSSRSLYNDGSAASAVTLAPFDAILLRRQTLTQQTITFGAPGNQTLATGSFSVSPTASSGLPITVSSTTPLVCLAAGNIVTLIVPGACSLTATQTGNGSYTAAVPVTQTFQVLQNPQTITFTAPSDQMLSIGSLLVLATASSGLPIIVASDAPLVCLAVGNLVTFLLPGNCSLTATQPGNTIFAAAAPVTQTFQVLIGDTSPSPQTISFAPIPAHAAGANQFTITATASSGLAVILNSTTASVCKLLGNTVFLGETGTCSITATQPGNASYAAAPPVTQEFTVVPNLIANGGFESGSLLPWQLLLGGESASVSLATSSATGGQYSAHLNVTQTMPPNWKIDFQSGAFSLTAGKQYQVNFWAMSDVAPSIMVVTQGGPPLWPYYGLMTNVVLTDGVWHYYSLNFIASATVSDATLEFWLGAQPSNIWFDNVQLFATGN
jgi:hypothetical protein